MEIVFNPSKVNTLDRNDPKLYVGIKSAGLAAVNFADAEIILAVIADNGQLSYRSIAIDNSVLTEVVANNFAQVTLDTEITDKVSKAELQRGVVPVGMNVIIHRWGAASAVSTPKVTDVQVTKSSQSGLVVMPSSDLLGKKILYGCSSDGAAATDLFMETLRYPAGR